MVVHPVEASLNHGVEVFKACVLGKQNRARALKLVKAERKEQPEKPLLLRDGVNRDAVEVKELIRAVHALVGDSDGFCLAASENEILFLKGI